MKGYGSTSLWNLTFVGGIGPVICKGLRLQWICVCAPTGGSGSLLLECNEFSRIVFWGVCGFGMVSCSPFYNIHCHISVLLKNRCGVSCTGLSASSVELAFHVGMETLGCVPVL